VPPAVEAFLAAAHLAVLTTRRPDGSLHSAPVRFTFDARGPRARVLTTASSRKARNLTAAPGSRVSLCQVDGFSWVTLEGAATVCQDPAQIAEGVRRYAARYWSPPPNPPGRVVIEIDVDRVLSLGLRS
jgi:PPOX class probable F420-dependent enzyme